MTISFGDQSKNSAVSSSPHNSDARRPVEPRAYQTSAQCGGLVSNSRWASSAVRGRPSLGLWGKSLSLAMGLDAIRLTPSLAAQVRAVRRAFTSALTVREDT